MVVIVDTKLGWVLSGPIATTDSEQSSMNLTTTHVLKADVLQPASESLNDT